ncbi:MAG TPA: SGNH/GDSL hydrolase family protein [Vicinamibacterales bacterium]|nr:SGNH/GDSL hydrolase family protein [Vicinamibacterales bacterium]
MAALVVTAITAVVPFIPVITVAPVLPVVVVAIGDSTTAGTPAFRSPLEAPPDGAGNVESQYAYWLSRSHPDWRVLNRGVNGERSDQIRARFERDALRARPSVIVIVAGVNDVYQGRDAASVERELEAMYDAARTARVPVVAGTIIPFNTATSDQNARMRAVNDWIRAYTAAHADVVFCDTRAAVAQPGNPDRLVSSPDNLHPSPDGYRLMALALEPAVKHALSL